MNHPESDLQQQVIQWCQYNTSKYPELEFIHHSPNGGKRNVREAARFKREGVKAGFPDLILPASRHNKHGLFIELKAPGGVPEKKLTKDQKKWRTFLLNENYAHFCINNFEKAIELIEWYLG